MTRRKALAGLQQVRCCYCSETHYHGPIRTDEGATVYRWSHCTKGRLPLRSYRFHVEPGTVVETRPSRTSEEAQQ